MSLFNKYPFLINHPPTLSRMLRKGHEYPRNILRSSITEVLLNGQIEFRVYYRGSKYSSRACIEVLLGEDVSKEFRLIHLFSERSPSIYYTILEFKAYIDIDTHIEEILNWREKNGFISKGSS